MSYQTITVRFDHPLATVCLNRREKRNALLLLCMRELIEEISRVARKSKYIDQQSGVSARLSIANYRTMIASARQRAVREARGSLEAVVADVVERTLPRDG